MSPAEQVEVRREFRSVTDQRRLRTWRLELICRLCAMAEWERHDQPQGRQGSLLP